MFIDSSSQLHVTLNRRRETEVINICRHFIQEIFIVYSNTSALSCRKHFHLGNTHNIWRHNSNYLNRLRLRQNRNSWPHLCSCLELSILVRDDVDEASLVRNLQALHLDCLFEEIDQSISNSQIWSSIHWVNLVTIFNQPLNSNVIYYHHFLVSFFCYVCLNIA